MSSELSVIPPMYGKDKDNWLEAARAAWTSGLLPKFVTKPETCMYLMYRGLRAGLDPFVAAEQTSLINGKLTYSIQVIKALLAKNGVKWQEVECTNTKCVTKMFREGWETHIETYDLEDAKAQGLLNKDTFRQYPKLMLRANCLRRAAAMIASDIMLGMEGSDEPEGVTNETQSLPEPAKTVEAKAAEKSPRKTVKQTSAAELPQAKEGTEANTEQTHDKEQLAQEITTIETTAVAETSSEPELFSHDNPEHKKLLISVRTASKFPIRHWIMHEESIKQEIINAKTLATEESIKEILGNLMP